MKTKINIKLFSYLAALTIGLFVVSCADQEDNTDLSTFVPTSPTLTVTTSASSTSLIEDNSVYTFTATLSTPQLVDTKLFVNQISGNATLGDDYTVDGSIVIPAGATSATGKVKILADDLVEDTETVKLQIGDNKTANVQLTPATMDFSILNYTDGDLAMDFSWEMASKTTDGAGEDIDPTDFADMRLLISSTPDNSGVLDSADGSSFETYIMGSDTPDGTYYVVADFYSSSEIVRDLNFNLNFNQAGVIDNNLLNFGAAMSSGFSCSIVYYTMAKIEKAGTSYTITPVGELGTAELPNLDPFVGTANALQDDWADYTSGDTTEITLGDDPWTFRIDTPDFMSWIANNDTAYMEGTVNPIDGSVTILSNEPFDYGQGLDGSVYGTGSINYCSGMMTLSITYDLGGWGVYPDQTLILQVN